MANNQLIFIDANVLLEVVLDRKNNKAARKFIKQNAGNLYISALTAHLVVHFGQSIVGLPVIRKFLSDYFMVDLTEADFNWAFINSLNDDFEDALQLGCAIRSGCDIFATFDKNLFDTYKKLPTIKLKLLST